MILFIVTHMHISIYYLLPSSPWPRKDSMMQPVRGSWPIGQRVHNDAYCSLRRLLMLIVLLATVLPGHLTVEHILTPAPTHI